MENSQVYSYRLDDGIASAEEVRSEMYGFIHAFSQGNLEAPDAVDITEEAQPSIKDRAMWVKLSMVSSQSKASHDSHQDLEGFFPDWELH